MFPNHLQDVDKRPFMAAKSVPKDPQGLQGDPTGHENTPNTTTPSSAPFINKDGYQAHEGGKYNSYNYSKSVI